MGRQSETTNSTPRILDLFCGVGGFSLGAARAGFNVVAGVDNDARTIKAHNSNFPHCNHVTADIASLSGTDLLRKANVSGEVLHGVIGGPPCQGFSRIGRRNSHDERNTLFSHFFRLVSEIKPHFYVSENVPGILDPEFAQLRTEALDFVDSYTNIGPLALNASDFGVPTSRQRVFFIGYLPDQMGALEEGSFSPPEGVSKMTVRTALSGLRKKISSEWQTEEQGVRYLTCRPVGLFWNKVFAEVPPRVGNQESVHQLIDEDLVSGCLGTRHTKKVTKRFASLAEGEVDKPSRAVRLRRAGTCPTLRSGTGPERGSFQALRPIHPTEPRVITPREAARLQGFPDWYIFDSTKWHSFRQIGNSVSPILGECVMAAIRAALSDGLANAQGNSETPNRR